MENQIKLPPNYRQISKEELARVKGLTRKVENLPFPVFTKAQREVKPLAPASIPGPPAPKPRAKLDKLFDDRELANVIPTRKGLDIESPVMLAALLMPELKLYKWQYEELLIFSGRLTGSIKDTPITIDENHPLLRVISAANGSGKDLVMIALCAVWFALVGQKNRFVITSSSFEQIKSQTEVHIANLAHRANAKFGKLFHSVQFHYIVPELGSEIKLFVTDEPRRAEGWHPFPGGRMVLCVNEAKSVPEGIFEALDRCTGYSYIYYVSSPGNKRGRMYKEAIKASQEGEPITPGRFSFRKVTAFDCPHIPKSHIERKIYDLGEDSPWVQSSIYANFADYDESVAIPESIWDYCVNAPPRPQGDGIGIGLDWAMGGDELYCCVRKGNKIIHRFGCRQKDSKIFIPYVDNQLAPWKKSDYVFRADDGGVGKPLNDAMKDLGWVIRRTNNQSPANKKAEFLNLGAEMYFHVRRLLARRDIIVPNDDPKLKQQIVTRRFDGEESRQGKFALQSKKAAAAEGLESPDRADSLVLCFSSYHPNRESQASKDKPDEPKTYTVAELIALEKAGRLFAHRNAPVSSSKNYTQLIKV